MRAASQLFLVCLAALGCSVQTTGLGPRDAGRADSALPVDAPAATDARMMIDALVPPPPFDAGTDAGPPPPPDAGPPPMTDAGPPSGSVGDGCAWDGDCQPGLECFTESWLPGGYCSRSCWTDGDCAPWGACVYVDGYRYCGRRCSSSSECRPGYACSSGVCAP